jgi:3-dehydroquinate synthase
MKTKKIKCSSMRILLKREVDESYDLVFGHNLFSQISSDLKKKPIGEKYAIITDSNVRQLYSHSLEERLSCNGLTASTFSFVAGEQNKTIENAMKIIGEMSKLKYGRDIAILALGGGVVGDLAGFIAAIFNRGVPYIQIPTTLLAQADSSVGGKTAVDTEYGKNLVGAFKQPERVYIDIATLITLSDRDYSSGLAETIKHGIIRDAKFFNYLSDNQDLMMKRNPEFLLNLAKNNCRIKGEIVELDPHEIGLRRILNYGHTAGHAIEKLSLNNYEQKENLNYLSHGGAVAIGMMIAGRIAKTLGYFSEEELEKQKHLLLAAGLPIKIPSEISNELIIEATSRDKKAKNGQARYTLPVALGKMHEFGGVYAAYVDNKIVLDAIKQTR